MALSTLVTQYREIEFDSVASRAFGSALLAHIVASMEMAATQTQPPGDPLGHTADKRALFYAAHDTNLLYLQHLLDVQWLLPGWQPNHTSTPPGCMLVIELRRRDQAPSYTNNRRL